MKITMPFPSFRDSVRNVVQLFGMSELGIDAQGADGGAVCLLRAAKGKFIVEAAHKGLEVRSCIQVGQTEEEGELAVRMALISDIAVAAQDVTLNGDARRAQLKIKAGRLNSDINTSQSVDDIKAQAPEAVPLTHTFPAKELAELLKRVSLDAAAEQQPYVRLIWTDAGLRAFTHNPYIATHAIVTRDPAEQPLDVILPAKLALKALETAENDVAFGTDGKAFKIKTPTVNLTHPLRMVEIDDVDAMVTELGDVSDHPRIVIDGKALTEALSAVASIDRKATGTKQFSLHIVIDPTKPRITMKAESESGATTARAKISEVHGLTEEKSFFINLQSLRLLLERLKGDNVTLTVLDDRLVIDGSGATFMLTYSQQHASAQ